VHEHVAVAVRVDVLQRALLDLRRLQLLAGFERAAPVSMFRSLQRVNAWPLPGLTNWKSTTT